MTPLYHASKHVIFGLVRCLAELERVCRIRVVAVAPGLVRTTLWFDNPHKLRMVEEENKDEWVTPEQVGQIMLSVVGDNEISRFLAGAHEPGEEQRRRLRPKDTSSSKSHHEKWVGYRY